MSRPPWDPPLGERPYGDRIFAHEVPHAATPRAVFSLGWIIGGWLAAYAVAAALQVLLATTFDVSTDLGEQPGWFIPASALALWVPQMVLLVVVARRSGAGTFAEVFRLRFKRVDLWGVPLGVLSQLLLVGLVTWPFREWFPERFDEAEVEQRARGLFESSQGIWLVALALVVVVGAPFIEEMVYRGFVQAGLQSRLNDWVAVVLTAAFFAAVHGRVAELPGLFSFALVLGITFHMTRRLGMPVIAHLAFNATGLALLALT